MQPIKQLVSKILPSRGNFLQAYTRKAYFSTTKTLPFHPPKNVLNHQWRDFHCDALFKETQKTNHASPSRAYSMSSETLMEPKGRVAIITGAATGTGYSIAKKLLCCGAKVLLVDIDGPAGKNAAHMLGEQYGQGNVLFYHGDVACEGHIHAFFRKCFDHFGAVNILVNNASVMDASNWMQETDINFLAVAKSMEISFDHLSWDKGVKGGFILNMCSTYALKSFPVQPTFCASGWAILGLTKSYTDPFYYRQRNIRMAVLCAGPTCTAKIEKGRDNLPTAELRDEYDRVMAYECKQNPDAVGAAAVKMICNAPHGSTWVVENGELFMINYPPYKNCRIPATVRKLCN